MILNNRKSGTINLLPILCFNGAVQILAIICYISFCIILGSTHKAASLAIDQFVNGKISMYSLKIWLLIFLHLHFWSCCLNLNLPLVYIRIGSFYQNWHSGALFCVSNLLLYLPLESFVFTYVDAFNFNSTHWVILR